MFWTGFIYFVVGMALLMLDMRDWLVYNQLGWIAVLCLPLVIKPLAKFFNMRTIWEIK
jgi:hypothetical protein